MAIKITLADDHKITREGLLNMLEDEPDGPKWSSYYFFDYDEVVEKYRDVFFDMEKRTYFSTWKKGKEREGNEKTDHAHISGYTFSEDLRRFFTGNGLSCECPEK